MNYVSLENWSCKCNKVQGDPSEWKETIILPTMLVPDGSWHHGEDCHIIEERLPQIDHMNIYKGDEWNSQLDLRQ